jgi:hypothetical protein
MDRRYIKSPTYWVSLELKKKNNKSQFYSFYLKNIRKCVEELEEFQLIEMCRAIIGSNKKIHKFSK